LLKRFTRARHGFHLVTYRSKNVSGGGGGGDDVRTSARVTHSRGMRLPHSVPRGLPARASPPTRGRCVRVKTMRRRRRTFESDERKK